jgi:hypothetical protein
MLTSVIRNGTDPLVHHGRHFGRTVHALCSVKTLVTNGLIRVDELAVRPEVMFTDEYVWFTQFRIYDLRATQGTTRTSYI